MAGLDGDFDSQSGESILVEGGMSTRFGMSEQY